MNKFQVIEVAYILTLWLTVWSSLRPSFLIGEKLVTFSFEFFPRIWTVCVMFSVWIDIFRTNNWSWSYCIRSAFPKLSVLSISGTFHVFSFCINPSIAPAVIFTCKLLVWYPPDIIGHPGNYFSWTSHLENNCIIADFVRLFIHSIIGRWCFFNLYKCKIFTV